MLSQRLYSALFFYFPKRNICCLQSTNENYAPKKFCSVRTLNKIFCCIQERNHRLSTFIQFFADFANTEKRGSMNNSNPQTAKKIHFSQTFNTVITREKIIQPTFHYLPFLLPVWTNWEWHWVVKQIDQEGKGIIHKLYKQLLLWARVDSVWNWSKVSNNIIEDWYLGSEVNDCKRLPRPKENFILKIRTEHAASTPSSFSGIFVKLYVYKMVKNNKADDKQSSRPALLITVMLYVSPRVSASGKLNSNKNNHAHLSSLISLLHL